MICLFGTSTATHNIDYTGPSTSGSVTIPSGQTETHLYVNPSQDTEPETDETVMATMSSGTGYTVSPSDGEATLFLHDDDTIVSVEWVQDAHESGTTSGTFRFHRFGGSPDPLTASFTLSGTATISDDYIGALNAESVTFLAGVEEMEVAFQPVDDSTAEGPETVTVTITAGTGYNPAGNPATATIIDNDIDVWVERGTDAREEGAIAGQFVFHRYGGNGDELPVSFTLSGQAATPGDYSGPLTVRTVTFPAGSHQVSATLNFTPVDDTTPEEGETVIVTINAATNGEYVVVGGSATAEIIDNDNLVWIEPVEDAFERDEAEGKFRVVRYGGDHAQPLTVRYVVASGGTAIFDEDYSDPPSGGEVTIGVYQTHAYISVTPIDDPWVDGDKTLQLALTEYAPDGSGGSGGSGGGSGGQWLGYHVSGGPAEIAIIDDDVYVWVEWDTDAHEEGEATGRFAVHRDGTWTGETTVYFTVTSGGSADFDIDYRLPALGTGEAYAGNQETVVAVTFAENEDIAYLYVDPIDDPFDDGDRTVNVAVSGGDGSSGGSGGSGASLDYQVSGGGTATLAIIDNDDPVLVIQALDPVSAEYPLTTGRFRVVRLGVENPSANVSLLPGGDAIAGTDYDAFPATIPAPYETHTLDLPPIADLKTESTETVTLGLGAVTGYTIAGAAAHGIIVDDLEFAPMGLARGGAVRPADGTIGVEATDLSAAGFGVPFGHRRVWTNTPDYAVGSHNGNGWVTTDLPVLVRENQAIKVIVGTDLLVFDPDGSGGYHPRFFVRATLTHNPATGTFTLARTDGTKITFLDFGAGRTEWEQGRFDRLIDPTGDATAVFDADADGRIREVRRSATVGATTVTESLVYDWTIDEQWIASVTLRRSWNGGAWQTVRRAVYGYSATGNLETAAIQNAAGVALDVSYYRYDANDRLRYAVRPLGFARAAATYGTDPSLWSDAIVAAHADLALAYDSQDRVFQRVVAGTGSTSEAGHGSFTYTYQLANHLVAFNNWRGQTAVTLPDGNVSVSFSNAYAQPLVTSYEPITVAGDWITYSRYDGTGRTVLAANPSAVSGYDANLPDLLGFSGASATYLQDSQGVLTRYAYFGTTTASETTAGEVRGLLAETTIQRGDLGSPVPQEHLTYYQRTVDGATVTPLAARSVFRHEDGTGAQETTMAYTWHPGTVRIATTQTTLPVVATAENGSGVATTTAVAYDRFGHATWSRDSDAFLAYAAYDVATGSTIRTIDDVDTSQTADFSGLPSGWTTPLGGGVHAITDYEVDPLGRATRMTAPGGIDTFVVYNDPDNAVRTYAGWDPSTAQPTGPTVLTRTDRASGYTETLSMTASPVLDAFGRPTGTEPITGLVALSRTAWNPAGQTTHADSYFQLAGLSYSTLPNLGVEGTHFLRSEYGYGAFGRSDRVEAPDGTITRNTFDALGRVADIWIGDDDTPLSGDWSPWNPAGMQPVTSYQYDDGGVGDGNITLTTNHPGDSEVDRITRTEYDWRNRPVLVKEGAGTTPLVEIGEDTGTNRPITYLIYDNLGQVTESRVYDGDTLTAAGSDPVPPAQQYLRARTTFAYDALGGLYRTTDYGVDPATGIPALTSQSLLTSETWFDARGLPVKTLAPNGLVEKTQFDGLGRPLTVFQIDGDQDLTYADAFSVTDDTVLTQAKYGYDAAGNTVAVTSYERDYHWSQPGALGLQSSGLDARVSYTAAYHDRLGRVTEAVDAGTNNGLPWSRPATPPGPSDPEQVTRTEYNTLGNFVAVTSPAGQYSRTELDALGRITREVLGDETVVGSGNVRTTIYGYNGQGRLATVTAPGNLTTTYGYDWLGRPDAVTTPDGVTSSVSYNRLGDVTTSTDPTGLVSTTAFDVLGRPRQTTLNPGDPFTARSTMATYDPLGRLLSVTDPRQNTTTTAYRDHERSVVVTDPLGHTTTTITDVPNNQVTVRDAYNQATITTRDLLGRVIATQDPLLHTTEYQHNISRDRTVVIDPLDDTTQAVLDRFGRLRTAIDGRGKPTATYDYDKDGRVKAITDARGSVTRTAYDHLGRVETVTEADGTSDERSVDYTYHANGQVETITDDRGVVTKYGYDAAGRTQSMTAAYGLPEAFTTTYTYDNQSRVEVISSGGRQTKYEYTAFGEVSKQTDGYGTPLARSTQYSYDDAGNRTTVTDALWHTTTYTYDELNRIENESDALNGTTAYGYDNVGRKAWLSDPVGNTTNWAYYADGRLKTETDTLGKVTSYTWNADGTVDIITDRLGRKREFDYDDNGRTTYEYWKAADGTTVDTLHYEYDDAGFTTLASNAAGTYTFTPDALGRVKTVSQPYGVTLTFGYDAAGNRTSVTDSKGGSTVSAFDGLNRLTSRQLTGTGIDGVKATWKYHDTGEVAEVTRYKSDTAGWVSVGNSIYDYDDLGRVTSIHHKDATGITQGLYEYVAYDAADRLTFQRINGIETSFNYDDTNQLTADGSTSYTYDANGNRTGGGYTVGPNNRLVSDGTWTWTYDDANQVTGKSSTSGSWAYDYDHRGQMTSAAFTPAGGGAATTSVDYTYDVFGNRIGRSAVENGVTTEAKYLVDGGDTAKPAAVGTENFDTYADLDAAGNITERRMYGAGFDELIARDDGSGNAAWYLTDRLGSVREVVSDSGTTLGEATYTGFGAGTVTAGVLDRFRFTGREWDEAIELQYSRARVYDPDTGRFLSDDPIRFAAGDVNLGRYVGNNATGATDPSGNWLLIPAKEAERWGKVFQSDAVFVDSHPGWTLVVPNRTDAAHNAIAERILRNKLFTPEELPRIMIALYGGGVGSPSMPLGDLQDHVGGNLNGVIRFNGVTTSGTIFYPMELSDAHRTDVANGYNSVGGGHWPHTNPSTEQFRRMLLALQQQQRKSQPVVVSNFRPSRIGPLLPGMMPLEPIDHNHPLKYSDPYIRHLYDLGAGLISPVMGTVGLAADTVCLANDPDYVPHYSHFALAARGEISLDEASRRAYLEALITGTYGIPLLPKVGRSGQAVGRGAATESLVEVLPYRKRAEFKMPGQADHLNQSKILGGRVPYDDGLTTPAIGDAFRDVGTPHFVRHSHMEAFYDMYRPATSSGARYPLRQGPLYPEMPTFAQNNRALYNALQEAGKTPKEALAIIRSIKAEQLQAGFRSWDLLQELPPRMGQRGGPR